MISTDSLIKQYFNITALILVLLLLVCVLLAWKTSAFSEAIGAYLRYMSLGTATCLFLLTFAQIYKLFSKNSIGNYLCLLVLAFAIVRLWELETGYRHLDNLFKWLTGFSLDHENGAMSYLTSICLILVAISTYLGGVGNEKNPDWKNAVSLILNFYVAFLVIVALSGYILNLMSAFTWMGMRMSPHTAISLLILSIVNFRLNFQSGLHLIFTTGTKQRFIFGALVISVFGLMVFTILQQQIDYVSSINNAAISKLASSEASLILELQKLMRTEYELKELVLVLTGSFSVVCIALFSSIFLSLMYQMNRLSKLLVDSVEHQKINLNEIPYLTDTNEFGLIARSIQSFISLSKSQERLKTRLERIIESMPNGVIIINQFGKMELVNQQVCSTFQYNREELIGNPIEMLMPQSIAEKHPGLRENFFKAPEARAMGIGRELFGATKYGKEVALEIGLAPIESDLGLQVLASIVDITEKKLAQKNLELSREKVEVTSKALGIGIWEYYPTGDRLIWDELMFTLYDADPAEFTGRYDFWRSRVHPDDISEQEKNFLYAIKTNSEFIAKFRIIDRDNGIKYIQAKAKIQRSENDAVHIIGTNFDITREEVALRKIRQLDTLRASIVEHSEDAIVSKTIDGILTSWNKAAETMFGYTAAEAIGRPVKDLIILPEYFREHDELIGQVRQGSLIRNYQTRLRSKNGKQIDVSVTFSPIKDDQGKIVSISSIKRDITESLKSARRLQEHQQELERSNKSLETFAYVASHDLKAPLRGISQLTSWLEEDIRDNNMESVPDTTLKIKVRIKRMEALLDDLLAYSRVEKMQGIYKRVDLNQSVADLFNMNNIKPGINLEISSHLPSFMTYVTPLEQVINNLISNAIKHHDRPEGVIRISAKDLDENWYEISVADDGPGIEEQFHERIFNMFQTLKPRDQVEGSGMGLTMVKRIVEQYGGKVGVESAGRGCRFYFTWPKSIKQDYSDE